MILAMAIIVLALAALPAAMTIVNLSALRTPAAATPGRRVAILIPARDEETGIAACIESALASTGVDLEVLVLDDHSTDRTAAIVATLAVHDDRLRLIEAPFLPEGWSGKQHACHILSLSTDAPFFVFLDADVRLAPAAVSRLVGALSQTDLVSGVPRQIMSSLAESLIIPMINAVLLGYLPIPLMRKDPRPALGAGCGQLIAVRADSYRRAGGHAAIRHSLHDGLMLPRAFRRLGLQTDLVDGTSLATCRMYAGWPSVVAGTIKNATEGMATFAALPVWSVLLLGGHVLPWIVLAVALDHHRPVAAAIAATACLGSIVARLCQALRCGEPLRAIPLHPLGMLLLVALQWLALMRHAVGRPATWRGRRYSVRT